MKKLGFIGIGIMGKPMAKNLIDAGYPLVVYDINSKAIEEMVDYGAKSVSSCKEVASQSEIIITMLPNSPEVEKVVLGEDGVIEGNKKGSNLNRYELYCSPDIPEGSKRIKEKRC